MVLNEPISLVRNAYVKDIDPDKPIGNPTVGPRGYIIEDFQSFDHGFLTYALRPVNVLGEDYGVRLDHAFHLMTGIFIGVGASGRPHAVAWDGQRIYDPAGGGVTRTPESMSGFTLFYRYVKIRNC